MKTYHLHSCKGIGKVMLLGLCALAINFPVLAADLIEEITVTARKREESLQQTPISITAFDAAALEARSMNDLRDIGNFTPNMTFTSYGIGNSDHGAIFLRGIGQSDHLVTTDPGVGLYLDGVYMGRNMGAVLDLLDIKQVEVLRGPQGTLFGKNTIGGAVNVVSDRPSGETGGTLGVTGGSRQRINGMFSFETALNEHFSTKVSGLYKTRDGVGEQIYTGDELGDENSFTGRAQFLYSAPGVEVHLAIDGTHARQGAAPHSLFAHNFQRYYFENFNTYVAPTVAPVQGFTEFNSDSVSTNRYDNPSTDDLSTELDVMGISSSVTWDVSETISIKSITAWRSMEYVGNLEFDGSPFLIYYFGPESGESDQLSQEFQFQGDSLDGTVTWILGAYYFHEDGFNTTASQVVPELYTLTDPTRTPPPPPPLSPAFFARFDSNATWRYDVTTSSYAIFGQGTYDVTEQLSITGGARYTLENKDYVGTRNLVEAGGCGFGPGACPTNIEESWNAASGTAVINYQYTDDLMVYFSYAHGFRSGGFNARPLFANQVDSYDPEFVDVFEIGLKSDAFDGRLRANISAYYSDYSDYQVQVNAPVADAAGGGFSSRTENAATAEIKGFELELTVIPMEQFVLQGNLGYTDAEITKIDPAVTAGFPEGAKLPYVSKWTMSFAPEYTILMANGGAVSLRGDVSYRSGMFGQIGNSPLERQGGYSLFNARARYVAPDGNWEIAAYGRNLGDKEYARVKNDFVGGGFYDFGVAFASWNTDRREAGVEIKYHF
ncbi:MAG: TonB-dependent receptor [Gammaproteobacteria bacterium]